MFADFVLGFDKTKKLILIDTLLSSDEGAQERIRNMINQNKSKEVSRDSDIIKMQGEILSCVTMEVRVPISSDKTVKHASYYFTCPTK